MKLKIFFIGLLSVITINQTDAAQRFQKMREEQSQAPVVRQHIVNTDALLGAGGGAVDTPGKATHVQGLVHAGNDLTTGIGNVNGLLGAGGGADAHAKATNLLARLNAGANAVGNGNNHVIVYAGAYPTLEAWIAAQGW